MIEIFKYLELAASAWGIHCEGLTFTVFIVRNKNWPVQPPITFFHTKILVSAGLGLELFPGPSCRDAKLLTTWDTEFLHLPSALPMSAQPFQWMLEHPCDLCLCLQSEKMKWCQVICCCYDRKKTLLHKTNSVKLSIYKYCKRIFIRYLLHWERSDESVMSFICSLFVLASLSYQILRS